MRNTPKLERSPRARRGSALILVLLMTITLAALALSAIVLTGSGSMLTRYYDREREFRYAAEAALAMGKSQLTKDTSVHLPDSGYVTLMSGGTITGADGLPLPKVKINLYAGKSGNVTGQFGQYASLIAEAFDASGTRYVRRLELQAENFARFAMFTNSWIGGLCYTTGEFIRGRAHSNQGWNSCGTPTYYDTVSAVTTVGGGSPVYQKGFLNGAPNIPIPPISQLAILHNRAVDGDLDVISNGTNGATVRTRLEFVAIDLDNNGTTTGDAEGFFRVYQSNRVDRLRVDPVQYSAGVNSPPDSLCGDWHTDSTASPKRATFWPTGVHNAPWMWARFAGRPPADTFSTPVPTVLKRNAIMANAGGFRCYPAGDPHLVAIERSMRLSSVAAAAEWQKGGEDTTFTDSTTFGYWQRWGGASGNTVAALSAISGGSKYAGYQQQSAWLWPLHRSINNTTRGVIHVHGPIALSGVLRGQVTIYAATTGGNGGNVVYIDDLVYAQDPAAVLCANLLGVIADNDEMIADNAINSPLRAGAGMVYRWTDGNDNGMATSNDFVFHGVMMSRTGTIGVENYGSHAESKKKCNGAATGRGCIVQAGGVIEQKITATYSGGGTGYGENRSVDRCMMQQSPPYFPTTGRYADNRFYELDPVRFNPVAAFVTLQGGY